VSDPDRRARFEREARALASLNHPNIAQIYGVEDTAGTPAIVMELVEGEDLAARIARGPIPWSEALPIVRQIADALDAAHERGVVHRDLKPANIKITPDNNVKVLDFGLAKAMAGGDGTIPDPQNSPTFTSPSTQLGMIVGTAAYMAPEQAKGKPVDKRADIWAFGCVLYEMLTGRSPFGAESVAESIGLVVTRDPDWNALPTSLPSGVIQLLRRCLLKDPRQRLRDIGEAAWMLAAPEAAQQPGATSLTAPAASRRVSLTVAVGVVVLAAAAAALAWHLKPAPELPLRRLELHRAIAGASSLALAPDGARLAYLSNGHLYVRELSDTTPRDLGDVPVSSTSLFWSPDGRSIGFVADATLRTVPVSGGPAFTVCRLPESGRLMGVAWRTDGAIVFSGWRDNLYSVPATGGTPKVLLAVDRETEVDFHDISPLPDGRMIVGAHVRAGDTDRAELVDGTTRTVLTADPGVRAFKYVRPGLLLFLRTDANRGLWGMPYSPGPLDLTRAVLLEADATEFHAAEDGTLLVRADARAPSGLVWVDRDGSVTDAPGDPISDLLPWVSLSPQGDRAAFVAGLRGQTNVFVRDLTSGVDTRLTFQTPRLDGGMWAETLYPVWFPSGDRLLYTSGPVEGSKVMARRVDGSDAQTELATGIFGRISPDSRHLVWITDERGQGRLRYAPWDADGALGEAKPAFRGAEQVNVRQFDLSPDGRLLAYSGREANATELSIYLTDFPDGETRWRVPLEGAISPRFSHDGKELYFLGGARLGGARARDLMRLPLTLSPSFKLGRAVPRVPGGADGNAPASTAYDVARDGRVLMTRRLATAAGETSRLVLVQNWPAALEASGQR
jgi:Tol biopolymer transport system component